MVTTSEELEPAPKGHCETAQRRAIPWPGFPVRRKVTPVVLEGLDFSLRAVWFGLSKLTMRALRSQTAQANPPRRRWLADPLPGEGSMLHASRFLVPVAVLALIAIPAARRSSSSRRCAR